MHNDGPIVLDTPQAIAAYRLLALRSSLKLELLGMKRSRRPSAYAIICREFKFAGSPLTVYEMFSSYLRERGIL